MLNTALTGLKTLFNFAYLFIPSMSTSAKAKMFIPKVTKALAWKYFTGISTSSCFLGESNLSHPCGKSERVFSVAGNVVTQKRASLAPEKVGACVIVKSNLGLLRHMGMRSK